MSIKHAFTSGKSDPADTTLIKPSDWNADHSGDFVSGASGSGNIVIPGLAVADRKPSSPSSYDDEFDALSGWTSLGTLDTSNVTDVPSHWHAVKNATGGGAMFGIYKTAPSMPFTVTTKITAVLMDAQFRTAAIFVAESSPGKLFKAGPFSQGAASINQPWSRWTNNTTRGAAGGDSVLTSWSMAYGGLSPYYQRLVVHASNNIDILLSWDGLIWNTWYTGIDSGLTVANVGLCIGSEVNSVKAEAYFDWIRFS